MYFPEECTTPAALIETVLVVTERLQNCSFICDYIFIISYKVQTIVGIGAIFATETQQYQLLTSFTVQCYCKLEMKVHLPY
jgi:hypothetical protein